MFCEENHLEGHFKITFFFCSIVLAKTNINMTKPIVSLVVSFILSFIWIGCTVDGNLDKANQNVVKEQKETGPITLVIHGGAGTILKENMTPELEKQYREKLEEALQAGYKILADGRSSIEAVVASIQIMEASPLFNAGVGAVYTHDGRNELDASIMDGQTGNAGAVAGVTTIKSPIQAALEVMLHSSHVMMAGPGAEAFAEAHGLEMVPNSYFGTERRKEALEKALKKEVEGTTDLLQYQDWKYGTVGAVALDQYGNIAAGTSTGGMTNKRYGRIGDSPIIGAGTFAENSTCGVSCTGHGEYFIRNVVAYDIAARMKYEELSVQESATKVVQNKLAGLGGEGGVICLDRKGNVAMEFNTSGMYRGYIQNSQTHVYIYKEE